MKSKHFKTLICAFLFSGFLHDLSAAEIHDALRDGNIAKAMNLLTNNPSLVSLKEKDGDCTPLHWAAQLGQTNVVRWLLEHKADPNAIAYNNFTPLHLAKNGTVVKLLLKYGADPKKIDSWGKTPLQKAAESVSLRTKAQGKDMDDTEVANAILESGYPIDLASALWLGKRDEAKRIIRQNPSAVKPNEGGADLWENTSPLGIAAAQGDKEIVELLLKAGAPVNNVTERPEVGNLTPLCNAIWAGNTEIVELLCKAGADCNVTIFGRDYKTLFEYAKKHSDKKIIELLVKYGAKD
jgi:ankyrin repeat protein